MPWPPQPHKYRRSGGQVKANGASSIRNPATQAQPDFQLQGGPQPGTPKIVCLG
jgi:hypothetical protein